jgi:3,4-dihydroxy 2-butanone 4-phosphate synthase
MFTGRIEEIGEIASVMDDRIVVRAPKSADRVRPGGSLNVAGVCVTAEQVADGVVTATVSAETRRRTTFDCYGPGLRVNVEPALAVGDPLDGHLVQGHVDSVGKVAAVDIQGAARRLWIRPSARVMPRVTAKGPIAVDGVSLAVVEVARDRFSVVLIPATLEQTTLGVLTAGDRVNLESDQLGRLAAGRPATASADVARVVSSLGWAGRVSGRAGAQKAVAQLAAGGGVMVWDPDREGEGDVIFAGAVIRPEAFAFLLTRCCGHPTVPCAPEVLERLDIPRMPGGGDRHGTRPHVSVDLAAATGTGVSAAERAATVRRLADPGASPADFLRPGHVFPLAARPGLLAERGGHTESTAAMCLAAGLPPVGVCCEVLTSSPALEDSVGEVVFGGFCHGSRCQAEACEVRDAGGAERGAIQPGVGADEVERCGVQDVGEVGLGLAVVGGAAHPGGADGLGDGALDAGADVAAGLPSGGLLLGALAGEDLVLLAGQQGQAAPPPAVRRLGAPGPHRARVAVGECEVDPGDRGAAGLSLVGPADADRPLGTGDLAGVPVDGEGVLRQERLFPVVAPGLGGVGADRPDQGDPVVVAGGEDVPGADVAGVDGVLGRGQPAAGQALVDDLIGGVLDAGLILTGIDEPCPDAQALGRRPDLADHRRRPPLLIISARKP